MGNKERKYNDQYDRCHIKVQSGRILQHKDANQAGKCSNYNFAQEKYKVANAVDRCHLQCVSSHGVPGLKKYKNSLKYKLLNQEVNIKITMPAAGQKLMDSIATTV